MYNNVDELLLYGVLNPSTKLCGLSCCTVAQRAVFWYLQEIEEKHIPQLIVDQLNQRLFIVCLEEYFSDWVHSNPSFYTSVLLSDSSKILW